MNQDFDKLRGAKLLLAEDNEINQELLVDLLHECGIELTIANNGQEALDILDQEQFDGILMDCQMPVMNGYDATRKIREQLRFKSLPIIAVTANAMEGDREKAISSGMNDHIAKPIHLEKVLQTLLKWIDTNYQVISMSGSQSNSEEFSDLKTTPELGISQNAGNPLLKKH